MTCSSFCYFVTFRLCEKKCSILGVNLDKKEMITFFPFNPQVRKHIVLNLKKTSQLDSTHFGI